MRITLVIACLNALVITGRCADANLIEKPDFFKTLVNPTCSHCVDEAKRRAQDLRADDRVLAWIRGKYDGGAVPFRFFLVPYRVISDTYGVWVYDADAGFIRGYEPSLDFSFYGWRNGIMVIRHKDGTLYSALSGLAFDGPRKGTALKPLPTVETDWGYWLKAYPHTVAYNMFDKYVAIDLPQRENQDSLATRPASDNRLDPAEPVIGVELGGVAKVYPLSVLANKKVIRDRVGDQDVVVLWFAPTRTAAIYAPRLENDSVPERLTLEANAQIATAPFMDKETFSHWTVEGRAVEGPLKAKTMVWLPGVQCKWFAWAAEYPRTQIYSTSNHGAAESAPSSVAKLIQGERLDWDSLVKSQGLIVSIDRQARRVTVLAHSDHHEHSVALTPHTEFYARGSWGTLTDFKVRQQIFVIATTDANKNWMSAHAIVDEISLQLMSSPAVFNKWDQTHRTLEFAPSPHCIGVVALRLLPGANPPRTDPSMLAPGQSYYFNSGGEEPDRELWDLLDSASLQQDRRDRWQHHLTDARAEGLQATVVEVDQSGATLGLMVRRADASLARLLKAGDAVDLGIVGSRHKDRHLRIREVRPDYARMRLYLDFPPGLLAKLDVGSEVRIWCRLPMTVDSDRPPDLGRFTARQDRIDYFLSTIYCTCGMMGTSCAGHWNTLAACKLHGCGMPNLMTQLIGKWIDEGKADADILEAVLKRDGSLALRQHQLPQD